MKSIALLSCALLGFVTGQASAQGPSVAASATEKAEVYTVTEHIRFNEGSLPLKNEGILLTNFGTETCDPLNTAGKGYVVLLGKENKILIPADGTLSAPKGMAVKDDRLFIADVGCIVAYNLRKPDDRPIRIPFPEGELFVNDIIALGDLLLISVTNTGHLFTIDVKDCDALRSVKPRLAATIPGANGLAEYEGTLYVASYDPNENPGAENVIYAVDITTPGAKPTNLLGSRYGQYDGLAVSPDGSKLYFSNWKNAEGKAEVGYIDLIPGKDNAVTTLDLGVTLQGPADICISEGYLFIPDLPASKLYIMSL